MSFPEIITTITETSSTHVAVHEVSGRAGGTPIVFVHGNVSSSTFFFPTMVALPPQFRPIAIDLRGFGLSQPSPVDATRGVSDFADDVLAGLEALGIDRFHVVGWSLGGGVVMQLLIDNADRIATATLINPVSPFGFGGNYGIDAVLLPGAAGSGAGGANPDFVARLKSGDTTDEAATSPRCILRSFYVAPGWDGEYEDVFVRSMLSTAIGEDNYPGTSGTTQVWPGLLPGDRGVLNTLAPTHLDLSGLIDIDPQPPILWVRGELDQIVSDLSMFDLATLGSLGVIPGWPGPQVAPPQPMVAQTRNVLNSYARAGGEFTELVIPGVGHSPQIEAPAAFQHALIQHVTG